MSGFARLERGDLFRGHGAHVGVGFGQHRACFGETLAHLLQLAELLHRSFKVAEGLAGLLILLVGR